MMNLLFCSSKQATGDARPSFSANLLSNDVSAEEESIIKYSAMSLYGGGADTVSDLI